MKALIAATMLAGAALSAAEKATPNFRVTAAPYTSPVLVEQRKEAQTQHASALQLLADNKLAAARTAFQKVLNLSPNNPAALINLGIVEQRSKNYGEAERVLRRAVQAAPTSGAGWLLLGVVSLEQGKIDAAFAHFAQAAFLDPKNAQARMYLAVSLARKGWNAGAEDEFRAALELNDRVADAHYNLAVLYLQRTPPAVELARRHYQRSIDLGAAEDPKIAAKLAE